MLKFTGGRLLSMAEAPPLRQQRSTAERDSSTHLLASKAIVVVVW